MFQRLFILFKLKPFDDARARGDAGAEGRPQGGREASSSACAACCRRTVSSDYVYIKLFKNMPRSDVEMIFPNTKVRFRLFDKIKFGVTAGSGLGMGVFGTASKIAIASNPYTLVARPGRARRRGRCARPPTSSTSATATWW